MQRSILGGKLFGYQQRLGGGRGEVALWASKPKIWDALTNLSSGPLDPVVSPPTPMSWLLPTSPPMMRSNGSRSQTSRSSNMGWEARIQRNCEIHYAAAPPWVPRHGSLATSGPGTRCLVQPTECERSRELACVHLHTRVFVALSVVGLMNITGQGVFRMAMLARNPVRILHLSSNCSQPSTRMSASADSRLTSEAC
jgi:hypothetical protein